MNPILVFLKLFFGKFCSILGVPLVQNQGGHLPQIITASQNRHVRREKFCTFHMWHHNKEQLRGCSIRKHAIIRESCPHVHHLVCCKRCSRNLHLLTTNNVPRKKVKSVSILLHDPKSYQHAVSYKRLK